MNHRDQVVSYFSVPCQNDKVEVLHMTFIVYFLLLKIHRIRALGSAALNMASVAAGGTDCYYEFGIHAWDMAAGDIIVREAGGVVMDTAGNAPSSLKYNEYITHM